MLGPSGCGKTTTLRMIAGFETPTEGAIRLEGEDVSRVPPHKRNVNTVFQHYALFPHMTVWDNVAYGPRSMKKDKAEVRRRVDELLEIVRLTDFAERKPAQLSGGQQQRVALARALVNYPSALLLDEPLGALDLKLRQVMQFELKRIQREVGITFVYVTHDQEEALTMSDRIAVMNAGNVDQIGTPDRDLRPPVDGVRRQLHRPGQPVGGQADRPRQPRIRRGRGARHHAEGPRRRHHDRTRWPRHADGPAGTRPGVDGRAHRRRRDSGAPRSPTSPSRARSCGCRSPHPTTRRSSRISDPNRTCRCCGRATRFTSAGPPRPRWCCRPPTSPPPRISRRCSTTPDGPPDRPVPLSPESTKGTSPWPPKRQIDPRLLSRLATNPTSRRRFIGGGAAAAAARWSSVPPSWPPADPTRAAATPTRRPPRPTTAHRHRAICASRTGRCTWPTASSPRSRPPPASRWTTRKTSTTTSNGSPRTRNRCRASRTSAPTWWCPPSSWPLRLNGARLAQRDQRRPGGPTRRTCARPAQRPASIRAASSPRRT